jgi:hypothetical protein
MSRENIDVGALQIQVVRVKETKSKSLLMKPCCRNKINEASQPVKCGKKKKKKTKDSMVKMKMWRH